MAYGTLYWLEIDSTNSTYTQDFLGTVYRAHTGVIDVGTLERPVLTKAMDVVNLTKQKPWSKVFNMLYV